MSQPTSDAKTEPALARGRAGGVAMVLVAAVFWGMAAILVKFAYRYGAEPLSILVVRYVVAAGIIWVVLSFTNRKALVVKRGDLGRLALLALAGYGVASIAFFVALTRIDASLAAIILYTYPTMVAAAAVRLFGERLTMRKVVALAMTFGGVLLAVWAPGLAVDMVGVLICFVAPVGYSAFTLMSFKWRYSFQPEAIVAWGLPLTAIPILLLAGPANLVADVGSWPVQVWLVVVALAVFPTIGAIGLYVRGMTRLGPSAAALTSTFEPVFTVLLAVLLLGERMALSQWVGAAFVVAGVAVAEGFPQVLATARPWRNGQKKLDHPC